MAVNTDIMKDPDMGCASFLATLSYESVDSAVTFVRHLAVHHKSEDIITAQIWSPFKELYHTVTAAVIHKQPDAIQDLEVILRKHKPDFISLLKNPAKNDVHRIVVKKANIEGLPVQGRQSPQVLTEQFIQEALILSDLFELNEFAAVELLIAAENQQPYFPGLTRGLVAVLLYYDGKTSLLSALRALIQSRSGRTWTLSLPDDLVVMTTKFTDQLMSEGLVDRILELLSSIDVTTDMTKLQEQRALGPPKHRKQVLDKITEMRQILAECLLAWSCQSSLSKANTLRLIQHLQRACSSAPDGGLDDVTLTLLMALLYSVDVRVLEQEDAEEMIQALPIVNEPSFIAEVHKELTAPQDWQIPGLKSVAQLAWAVALRTLPQYYSLAGPSECLEQDESIAEFCISEGVFNFLRRSVISSSKFHQENFYVKQIHNLVTDFIVQMPLKVKELRNSGDEAARIIVANQQEGLEPPPNLPTHFQDLMLLIGDLYGRDPLGLELALEFWCPPEPAQSHAVTGMASMYSSRPPQRQISLYKFVRMAGDLLPPPLFVPYLEMLRGLANGPQCANHCYSLLKSNGSGGHSSPVSWDHFFQSMNQYYSNLRQESVPSSDMAHVYRHHHHLRGITPQELQGLASVLKLTSTIADQSELARVSLCENQQWLPLIVLLGLLTCSVPTILKAEILNTLAALAKTPEIAANLWQAVEVSQILPTVRNVSSVSHTPGGIEVELDEVEARNEEYTMTLAFLRMIDSLTDSPVPAGLGAGYRAPGFQPYLDFLRDAVLLKFNTRAYKDPAQKWAVAASVLSILHKLLENYEVMYEDFVDQAVELAGEGVVSLNKPPGYSLMLHLLNETPMLKMILYIVDEASKLLDKFVEFPGHKDLERSALLCLQLIQEALDRQERFIAGLRETGASTMVSQVHTLLMGINPRSGKADHIVNIAKYVTYNAWLTQHSLSSVLILQAVCESPLVQSKLVGLLTANEAQGEAIRHGFVECIECDVPEELAAYIDITDEDPSETQVRCETRVQIVHLLLGAMDHPAPSLAHFLLGFEINKPVSKTNLQDPGVLNSPRTCLHAVLSILDKGVGTRTGPACLQDTPRLAALCYRLVYTMYANRETCTPTLRYLRTARDLLHRHLQHVPFRGTQDKTDDTSLLAPQAWLLKAVALELKLTAANKQRSHTQRLVNLLLDDNPAVNQPGPDGVYEPEFSHYENEFSLYTSQVSQQSMGLLGGQSQRKILAILDAIEFSQEFDWGLDLEYLNPGEVEQVMHSVEQRTAEGVVQGDVKRLMRMLMSGVTQHAQRQHYIAEARMICARMVERNAYREAIHTKKEAFESWRQVLEIILTACPSDLLSGELRQNVLFEVLQDLLLKVSKEDVVPELSSRVAGVILTLMANLRQCFLADQPEGLESGHGSQYISLLDGTLPANAGAGFGAASAGRTLYASSLQVVLRGLIEYLLRSSSGQRVRANLYGALLYYLQIAQKPQMLPFETKGGGVGARVTSGEAEYEKLEAENMATISSYGDHLMEVVCRDACDGHDVARMLSMATLDTVLSMERGGAAGGPWLGFLQNKGYLQHLLGSLLQDDAHLQAMLHPSPQPLRALYIFESKMGLLTRVAERAQGAHTLLQCGLMSRLAELTICDMRPEGVDTAHQDSFIPSVLNRYRKQILFPILKLCVAVLTSLGIENKQAASKVLQFVVAHMDVFTGILRERHPTLNVDALKELALTTAVVGRACFDDVEIESTLGDMAAIEFKGHVMRLQRQLIALLPRFCLSDKLFKQIEGLELGEGMEAEDTRLQIRVSLVEISANVIAFCRTLLTRSGTGSLYRILFGPAMDEAMSGAGASSDYYSSTRRDDYPSSMATLSTTAYPHSLGLVVYTLRQATQHFLETLDQHKLNNGKLQRVVDLSAEELKELCGGETSEKMSAQQRHNVAKRRLLHLTAYNTQELQLLSYILESCVLIIWRHLDYYLLRCEPVHEGATLYKLHAHKHSMRRLQESDPGSPMRASFSGLEDAADTELGTGVSRQELDTLKQQAVLCLNHSLFNKLHEIEQCYTKQRNRYGFMEALIRRIKRLLTLHTSTS